MRVDLCIHILNDAFSVFCNNRMNQLEHDSRTTKDSSMAPIAWGQHKQTRLTNRAANGRRRSHLEGELDKNLVLRSPSEIEAGYYNSWQRCKRGGSFKGSAQTLFCSAASRRGSCAILGQRQMLAYLSYCCCRYIVIDRLLSVSQQLEEPMAAESAKQVCA